MKEHKLPPLAPSFISSMRSLGYSVESAVADIIDNSITANADLIELTFTPSDPPVCVIADNGKGMSHNELLNAMRHGSQDPKDSRSENDLGRFGLGLKTASLSQCRSLTVMSKSKEDQKIAACRWDLDVIEQKKDWILLQLHSKEIKNLPKFDWLKKHEHGTLVIWDKLDKFIEGEQDVKSAFDNHLQRLHSHLSLVFHRYLQGVDGCKKLVISINGHNLTADDPFFLDNKATQKLPVDKFKVQNEYVVIAPYILPHDSKLKPHERKKFEESEGGRSAQGFYIYRNKRLILYGTWFKFAKAHELSKLARVQVDVPNTLDHLWMLDIKKSQAYPPAEVRIRLKQTLERITSKSRDVFNYRGRSQNASITPVWNRVDTRDGHFRYAINLEHPLLQSFIESLPQNQKLKVKTVIKLIESNYPLWGAYTDMAAHQISNYENETEKELENFLSLLIEKNPEVPYHSIIDLIHSIEPFNKNLDLSKKILMRLKENEQ